MELPKNITQIGESDRHCKIYVEDYVVSYIKQMNQMALYKELAVALYGTRKTEQQVSYVFIYGACKLDFLQRETKHLSQAQRQEIEKLRKKHFAEYEFLGYRLLNGERVEGLHICEQEICRYIAGYARFYEKNDGMLAYMLAARQGESEPEVVDREKYESVKKRQEERSAVQKEIVPASAVIRKMRVSVAGIFVLLGVAGFGMLWKGQEGGGLREFAKSAIESFSEQKLPDAEAVISVGGDVGTPSPEVELSVPALTAEPSQQPLQDEGQAVVPVPAQEPSPIPTPTAVPILTPTAVPAPTQTSEQPAAETVSYTIQQGDTLIGLSIRHYGNDKMVKDICALNEIDDPDDIRIGQKILLP